MNRPLSMLLASIATSGALLAGCAAPTPGRPVPLPYRLLHSSSACGTEAPSVQRVADRPTLNSMATSPVLGATAPPSPDFEASLVLRISMGQQATAGAQFGVTGVRAHAAERLLAVDTFWNPPDPGRMHARVVTRPCMIISVDVKPDSVRSVQAFDQAGAVRASALLPSAR